MDVPTRSRDEALLTVRLVLANVLEREHRSLADTVLAYDPLRVEPSSCGWIFAYRDAAYGLIARGDDGRGDMVWEAQLHESGARSSRLFDRAGRILQAQTVDRVLAAGREGLARRLFALVPPAGAELN